MGFYLCSTEWMGLISGTIWCMYTQSQKRYMQTVVIQTITRVSRTASCFEMFFVSFAKYIGPTTLAMTPRMPKTTVPVMMPGAANPYDSMDMLRGIGRLEEEMKKF